MTDQHTVHEVKSQLTGEISRQLSRLTALTNWDKDDSVFVGRAYAVKKNESSFFRGVYQALFGSDLRFIEIEDARVPLYRGEDGRLYVRRETERGAVAFILASIEKRRVSGLRRLRMLLDCELDRYE